MGLYDRGKAGLSFSFDFSFKQFKYPLLGLAAVIVLLLFLLFLFLLLQPNPVEAELSPNPLDLSKGSFNSFLTVKINNVTGETARNIVVRVDAVAADSLVVFPREREIDTLGKGEFRTLNPFSIRPNPGATVYSGSYDLEISTEINGQPFEKKVTLQLKTV